MAIDNHLVTILTNLGLNDKEAKVYLSCIKIGTSQVSKIAEDAKLNRVTTYDILEKLKKRGFVSHFTKQKTMYITAVSP
ncbi:MAG: helix-turn-helix domain-containing protein, partial [Candidatus Gracilibacteria bacterium]